MVFQAPKALSSVPAHQPQVQQQLAVPSIDLRNVVNPSSSANSAPGKPRMRWTPELHESFVDAVNQLGGSESQ